MTGTILASLIADSGVRIVDECPCNDWVCDLDEWGSLGCRTRIPEIARLIQHLTSKMRIDAIEINALILKAIEISERSE